MHGGVGLSGAYAIALSEVTMTDEGWFDWVWHLRTFDASDCSGAVIWEQTDHLRGVVDYDEAQSTFSAYAYVESTNDIEACMTRYDHSYTFDGTTMDVVYDRLEQSPYVMAVPDTARWIRRP